MGISSTSLLSESILSFSIDLTHFPASSNVRSGNNTECCHYLLVKIIDKILEIRTESTDQLSSTPPQVRRNLQKVSY